MMLKLINDVKLSHPLSNTFEAKLGATGYVRRLDMRA